jgi:hypothetical protein
VSGPSKPNFQVLRKYSNQVVPVANTLVPEYGEFERSERPLGEVLDLWEKEEGEGKGLYVKDWHLLAELEAQGFGAGEVYEVPDCFRGMSILASSLNTVRELKEDADGR